MSNQKVPMGDSEIINRAIKRAKLCFENQKADFCVGFSEGITKIGNKYFTAAWCAVMNRDGVYHLGGGLHVELPKSLLLKKKSNSLIESDIEKHLENTFENPFERLVEYATLPIKNS